MRATPVSVVAGGIIHEKIYAWHDTRHWKLRKWLWQKEVVKTHFKRLQHISLSTVCCVRGSWHYTHAATQDDLRFSKVPLSNWTSTWVLLGLMNWTAAWDVRTEKMPKNICDRWQAVICNCISHTWSTLCIWKNIAKGFLKLCRQLKDYYLTFAHISRLQRNNCMNYKK